MLRLYPSAPHPFIIEPPETSATLFKKGTVLSFGLILIGKVTEYLPYFIYTFEEIGKVGIGKGRGRYRITGVDSISAGGEPAQVYSGANRVLTKHFPLIRPEDLSNSNEGHTLTLRLITPLRIKYRGKFTEDLEFHIIFRNLLRRLSLLSYFHCGEYLDWDFVSLIDGSKAVRSTRKSLRWHDWERYSNRQKTRMLMGGLVGKVEFVGDFRPYFVLLTLGEYIHIGKGTTFGLGKYELGTSTCEGASSGI